MQGHIQRGRFMRYLIVHKTRTPDLRTLQPYKLIGVVHLPRLIQTSEITVVLGIHTTG